jgi:hypothetical protein
VKLSSIIAELGAEKWPPSLGSVVVVVGEPTVYVCVTVAVRLCVGSPPELSVIFTLTVCCPVDVNVVVIVREDDGAVYAPPSTLKENV